MVAPLAERGIYPETPMPPLRIHGDIRERLPQIEGREIRPIQHLVIACGGGEMDGRALDASQKMGIPMTTLFYTRETQNTLGVRKAREMAENGKNVKLYYLGEGQPRTTFGNENRTVEAIKEVEADTYYCGYGPMAENSHFVGRLEQEGIRFVGPQSTAMEQLGDKAKLKQLAQSDALKALNIPIIPASTAIHTPEEAVEWGEKLGYPLLVKMTAEGGGRGIEEIDTPEALALYIGAMLNAQKNATSLQGHNGIGEIILEKLIPNAKHVEIQIVGDGEDAKALGARECSAQIDRAKVAEISPPLLTTISKEKLEEIKRYSVELTKAAKYKGLVTVEWLVDENGNPFLLEANTRIQVEHVLNEILNSMDYVQLQLALEEGYGLPEEIQELANLVVMQVRLSAITPYEKFAARSGPIDAVFPRENKHLRIDAACGSAQDGQPSFAVPEGYNPLQAKIITVARTLEEAIAIVTKALDDTQMSPGSVETNKVFLRWLINTLAYKKGEITTTSAWPAWDEEIKRLRKVSKTLARHSRSAKHRYAGEDEFWPYTKIAKPEAKESMLDGTDVLVFRHGEDEQPQLRRNMTYNEFGEYINHPNSRLSQKGREQIAASLDRLTPEELTQIDRIFTSNIRRSRESAKAMQEYIRVHTGNIVTIEESSYLAEVTITADILPEKEYYQLLRDHDGDPQEAAREVYRRWEEGNSLLEESHKTTSDLIDNFLNLLNRRMQGMPSDGKAIVVTHGLISRALQYKMMGGQVENGRFNHELLAEIESLNNGEFLGLKREIKEEADGHQLLIPNTSFALSEQ